MDAQTVSEINADYTPDVVQLGEDLLSKGREMPRPEFKTDEELLAYGMGLGAAAKVMVSTHEKLSGEGAGMFQIFTFALALITGAADAVHNELTAKHPIDTPPQRPN